MRVLVSAASQLLTDHRPYGEGLICYQILSRLARRGHQLHVFVTDAALNEPIANARLYRIADQAPFAALRWWRFQIESARQARVVCRDNRIDVVHHLMPFYLGEHFSLVAGGPLVVGPIFPGWRLRPEDLDPLPSPSERFGLPGKVARAVLSAAGAALERWTFRRAGGVLLTASVLRSELPSAVQGKTIVVPFGVDPDRFLPGDARDSGDPPTVLFLANLARRKGLEYLLRAMPAVRRAVPNARLVVVGGGPSEEYFWRLAAELRLDDAVEFVGPVAHDATVSYYRRCDVYCLPSLGEPFGVSLLEAMACGKPVVATRAGGVPDLVVEGRSGYLVPPRDGDALATALVRLLTDRQLQRTFGEFNRQRCVEEFGWEAVVTRIEEVHRKVVAR